MGFLPRKLMSDYNSTSSYDCEETCLNPTPTHCSNTYCSRICPGICDPTINIYHPPPTPASDSTNPQKSTHFLFIIIFTVLGAAFLVLCLFVFYVRFYRNRSNGRRRSLPETTQIRDDFLDENHGPILDHPIWYINTIGLQPSIINSITVFKYKKGEGLVEGTDCSVCLSEFEEDETLRLLPKCSHTFHIPCIDTWLRSHTNCPMCRAPIVSNTENRTPEVIVNTEDFQVREENPVGIMEANGEEQSERSVSEGETSEIRIIPEEEEGGIQAMRRSVSLDSMAASQISQAIGNDLLEESNGDSENELDKRKESSLRILTRRGAGNQSLLRLMCHSSIGRSLQNSPNFLRRSLSFNGKFSLCNNNNNNKNRNTNPPVRSF